MAHHVGACNVYYLVDNARTTGRTPKSWRSLKARLSHRRQRTISKSFADVPANLLDLQDAVFNKDARRVKKVLVKMAQRLFEGNNQANNSSTYPLSTAPLLSFVTWGGLDIVIQLLFLEEPWLVSSPPTALQVWNLCIKLATEIVMVDPTLSWYTFSQENTIVRRALKLLSYRVTFENAAVMCEQLLASIGPCVDLGSVCTDFTALVAKMNDMQLALVCRVLALLVNPAWNVQVHDNSHKFAKLVARLKRVEALMQRNHDLVIDHPHILGRLVNLMKYQVNHLRSMQYGGSFALLLPVNSAFSLAAHAAAGPTHPNEPPAPAAPPPPPGLGADDLSGPEGREGLPAPTPLAPEAQASPIALTLASALISALGPLPATVLTSTMDGTPYPPGLSVQANAALGGGMAAGMDLGPPTPTQSMTWFFNPSPQQCDALVEKSLSESEEAASSSSCGAGLDQWGAPYSYQADARFASTINDALYGGIFGEEARSLSIVSCQSEVLFILSSLLSGRRSAEVWHRLAGKQLLQVIVDTFDSIFPDKEGEGMPTEGPAEAAAVAGETSGGYWGDFAPVGSAPAPHPQDREAREHQAHQNHRHDPETLRKMEYLRLVHEYWDCRDVYELHDVCTPAHEPSKQALAGKLARRLVRQTEDPCTDNVLTYALEAYLRGTPFRARLQEQEFLAHLLLPHLVRVIAECRNENRLESEFSLLAEIVKFNPQTLQQLEDILAADGRLYTGLVTVLCARPFHSNLFVRGLVLTLLALQPTCTSLLLPRLRCCPPCQAQAETHRSEFWEPYSVFVERIQRAKDIVGRLRSQDPTAELEALLGSLAPTAVDDSTCTICFENVLPPLPEEEAPAGCLRADLPPPGPAPHMCAPCGPLEGSPPALPPTLRRLIHDNQLRIIRNLMVEISLPQVCRENMCCVTTTLVFFVVTWHGGGLPRLLQQLRDFERRQAEEWCGPGGCPDDLYRPRAGAAEGERLDPFRNFFELVCIWLAYYAAQRHYQDTLFYCTHIPMSAWRTAVRGLLDLLPHHFLTP